MESGEPHSYTGRFAPSPSGPLHFGSLLAAAASYLDARAHNGRWLLRIEDIDPPREMAGADKLIVDALEAYGFEWDGPVLYQSNTTELHHQKVQELMDRGLAYRCSCSRRDLADAADGPLGKIYPGTCRNGTDASEYAIRVRTTADATEFEDGLQGLVSQRLETESGDFIILRRDGLIAYHLAVVVDDGEQQITDIVRGIDLMDSTPRQIYLQQLLGYPTPRYLHIPVAMNDDGQKLSKLTGATGVPMDTIEPVLIAALSALRLPVTDNLATAKPAQIWGWAIENWDSQRLRGRQEIAAERNPLVAVQKSVK